MQLPTAQGKILYQLRNIHTDEIEYSNEVTNTITVTGLDNLIHDGGESSTGTAYNYVAISAYKYVPSFLTTTFTTARFTVGAAIPGVSRRRQVWPTDTADGYYQTCSRFAPPSLGSTRTTHTVALTRGSDGATVVAFTRLLVPCVQTDSQYLDVYYRIFFLKHNESTYLPNRFLAGTTNYTYSFGDQGTGSSYAQPCTSPIPMIQTKKKGDYGVWPSSMQPYYYYTGQTSNAFIDNSPVLSGTGNARINTTTLTASAHVGRIITKTSNEMCDKYAPGNAGEAKFTGYSRIGNIIPRSSTASNVIRTFDVDGITTAKGSPIVEGDWNFKGTPSVPGLFYPAKFSTMYYIDVYNGGSVAETAYTWRKIPYFGSNNLSQHDAIQLVEYATGFTWLDTPVQGSITTVTLQYASATHRYDDTSVILVNTNVVALYNIAAGDYWRYTFPAEQMTSPNQCAVRDGVIYVGCRDTGLWKVDPRTETVMSSVSVPGLDISKCYGVHLGYNNTLWVVGNDGLGHFDGTSWTIYNSTTTPAFVMTGISDAKYSNVSYMKVDVNNANNQMILARVESTSTASTFGCWWSTVGTASNAWAESRASTQGCPRTNKTHLCGLNGAWFVYENSNCYQVAWGASARPTALRAFSQTVTPLAGVLYDIGGVTYELATLNSWSVTNAKYVFNTSLNSSGKTSITAGQVITDPCGLEQAPRTFTSGSYTYHRSTGCSILLAPGVVFYYYMSATQYWDQCWVSKIMNHTWSGNALSSGQNFINMEQYGWDGSQWVKGLSTPRVMHTAAEPLEDGMTIRFEDGSSGTSFNDGDKYNFVCCDGVWKDNLSTYTLSHYQYYTPVSAGCTDVENPIIGSRADQMPTGYVGPDYNYTPSWIKLEADNTITFDCDNDGVLMIGDKRLAGDFEVRFHLNNGTSYNNSTYRNITFGVGQGPGRVDNLVEGFSIDSTGACTMLTTSNWYASGGTAGKFSAAWGSSSSVTITNVAYFFIKRVGTTMTVGTNLGTLRTVTAYSFRTDYHVKVFSGNKTFNPGSSTLYTGKMFPIQIITNGISVGTRLGSASKKTGTYHPSFWYAEIGNIFPTVKIDGNPVSALYTGSQTALTPGSAYFDLNSGVVHCHADDNGKTLTATYTTCYYPTPKQT